MGAAPHETNHVDSAIHAVGRVWHHDSARVLCTTCAGWPGLVDAAHALAAATELSFRGRGFELRDAPCFVSKHSVNITNVGSEPVTYNFALQGAGGFDTWKHLPGDRSILDPVVPKHLDPLVTLPEAITVGVGETKEVKYDPPLLYL